MKLQTLPCYCATLRQAARAASVLYAEVIGSRDVPATQFTILQVLEKAPELTTTQLAALIGMDQTTATRTLALVKKSGLAKDAVGEDRRQRRWSLTAEGHAQIQKLRPRWEAAQRAFEKRLGREQAQALKEALYQAASRLIPS
jgi:DNA-binding MarR family transcriptional regulator